MQSDAELVNLFLGVHVTLSGHCTILTAENVKVVEIHHAGERETHESASEDEEENEVVAFGKAHGVVDLAHDCHEAVGWGP